MIETTLPGVTGNAILLLGYIAGSADKDDGGRLAYRTVEVQPGAGSAIIESRATGNTFKVSVVQVGGTI